MEGGKEERERRKGRSKRGKKRGRGLRRKKEGREREEQDEQKAREESQKQTKRKERNIAEEKTEPDPLGVEALYRKSVGSPGDSSMTCRSCGSEWEKVACWFSMYLSLNCAIAFNHVCGQQAVIYLENM